MVLYRAVSNGANAIKEITSTNQYVSVYPPNETVVQKLLNRFDIQVEYGGNATAYEPYGYLLDVKVTGKNRYDIEKAKIIDNWEECPAMSTYKDFPIYVGKGNEFSLSFSENLQETKSEIVAGVALVKSSGINKWIYDMGSNFNQSYSGFAKEDYIYIRSNRHRIQYFVNDIKTLQVEVNPIPTDFQPYTEQPLTLTSDRPITKWDKLVEQDGQIGWLYQSVAKEYIGDNSVELYDTGFYFKLSDKKIVNGEGYCEELKQYVHREENPCIAFKMSANIYAYTLNTQEIYGSTVSEIKEYLKSHPLHLVYKTEATEFVPLSESEQTQLRSLHSYNGATHITVDSGEIPCGINVEYKTKS